MQAGAHAGRSVADGVGLGLGQRHQFLNRLGRHLRIDRNDIGRAPHGSHGHKVAKHAVGQLGHQRRVDGQIALRHDQQRMAVGLGTLDHIDTDIAAGAGAVVDDGGLLVMLGQAGRQNARQDVHRTTCRERRNDGELPGGKLLGGSRRMGDGQGQDAGQRQAGFEKVGALHEGSRGWGCQAGRASMRALFDDAQGNIRPGVTPC
ncbi:hypothetical protein SDC9_133132 [bioreactor metagenome]|uniref:Uncharacterized protein n=1 Tax=bioreactor metagenome TaxID=1076179 RepID=A0A645DA39_9ZZZZ